MTSPLDSNFLLFIISTIIIIIVYKIIVVYKYDNKFLYAIVSILAVAAFMTTYELLLYFFAVKPQFLAGLDRVSNVLDINTPPEIVGILNGFSNNSENVGNYTNNLKFLIICLEISFMVLSMFVIIGWINNNRLNIETPYITKVLRLNKNIIGNVQLSENVAAFMNFIIVLIPILFVQVTIFLFAKRYKYGSVDEIKLRFVNSVLKYQGRSNEIIPLPSGVKLIKQ